MLELNLYESVYESKHVWQSSHTRPFANHKQNAPIVDQEELEFTLEIPDNEIIDITKYRMRIYKVDGIEETAEREHLYTLHFATKETVKNSRTTIKNALEVSDQIFTSVMREVIKTNKKLFVEPTNTNNKLLGNMMRPYDYLHMLAHRTSSRDFNGVLTIYSTKIIEVYTFVHGKVYIEQKQTMYL